jgi:hypothetical protein
MAALVSVSPTNMYKDPSLKQNVSPTFPSKNFLHILGYSFCTMHHAPFLVHFLPNAVAIRSNKIYQRNSSSALGQTNVGEIAPM